MTSSMDFKEYQTFVESTFKALEGKDEASRISYLALGLNGEAGEIAEKIKKHLHADTGDLTDEQKEDLRKELGDVLWYLTAFGAYIGWDLEDVAAKNKEKLASRFKRGVVLGDGDNR